MKCRKKTGSKNPQIAKTNKGKMPLLSEFGVCNTKKMKIYQKKQKASGLVRSLGLKIPIKFLNYFVLEESNMLVQDIKWIK